MTSPSHPPALSRTLWPLTALLALAGVVLLGLGLAGSAGRAGGDMVGFHDGAQVEVPEGGMSVWARSAQARTEVVCTAGESTLLRPVEDFTTEVEGQAFHEVARTPEELRPGTYAVSCGSAEDLYAGPYGPGTVATGLLGGTGVTLGLLLLPLALVCGLLAWAAGRRARRPEPGPSPLAYRLQEPYGQGPTGSPYATPGASTAAPGGPTAAPGASTASTSAPPFPGGGPFASPQPPEGSAYPPPAQQPRTGAAAPPQGPRYDLPPPS